MLNFLAAIHGTGVAASTNSYESIATQTVGAGGAASVTFSSIPNTYKHLQIRCIVQENYTPIADYDNLVARFNSDSGTNYTRHRLFGDGGTASALGATSRTSAVCGIAVRNGAGTNVFSPAVIDILDYTDTNKYKTVRSLAGANWNASTAVEAIALQSALWLNTSAITSITLLSDGGFDLTQYSSFALYGIKG